ncbi:hypothetical protein CY34DRAFT_807652 [Suillus luteus UH-Slu-Lm8-n1]|uniref:Uncharacterized protein n=1 Tax=Suillus luteus UH-Slu-Lm8-n1 TaxID=930992 RepID=A0A0D0B0C1_9AGAM|nr:hypothetical protein CY34DRAFT_807652 [Suillus luteus UH-Slu-Lm8-n1]
MQYPNTYSQSPQQLVHPQSSSSSNPYPQQQQQYPLDSSLSNGIIGIHPFHPPF